ncbi:VWA domain-containing protein [Sphingobacteriales bacterium UPWRP_1]|nr:hypothetical protein BVG80_04415 [Sphingobacteriales bacterium TSM_CSM]PSJ76066.1 VWA domain-containing protein [Sphingobacteriales bacterium UPWRP_1]
MFLQLKICRRIYCLSAAICFPMLFTRSCLILLLFNMAAPWHVGKAQTNSPALALKARTGNPYYLKQSPASEFAHVYLLIQVTAPAATAQSFRTPVNIAMVLDRSKSMRGAKLQFAKEAAHYVIDRLNKNDRIAIIAYDDVVQLVSPAKPVKNKQKLKKRVNSIEFNGNTNLSDGLFAGYEQVQTFYADGYVNRLLLLSDGLANKGITNRFLLMDTARRVNQNSHVTLSTFGLGAGFDEDLLEWLADWGGGNYYFIEKARKIPTVFKQELQEMQQVCIQQCRVEMPVPQNWQVVKVFGSPYTQKDNTLYLDFDDVFAGQTKTALIQLQMPPTETSTLQLPLYCTYLQLPEAQLQQAAIQLPLQATANTTQYLAAFDSTVLSHIVLFETNQKLYNAIAIADGGNYDASGIAATQLLNQLQAQLLLYPTDAMLKKQFDLVHNYIGQLALAAQYNEYQQKMMQKNAKHDNYRIRKKRK